LELSRTTAHRSIAQEGHREALLAGYTGGTQSQPISGLRFSTAPIHRRGDTIYASLESEDQRYLTLNRQQFGAR